MGRGTAKSTFVHIKSVTWSKGRNIRTLCGVWNAPTIEGFEAGQSKRLPKEMCPACRRLHEGGKV